MSPFNRIFSRTSLQLSALLILTSVSQTAFSAKKSYLRVGRNTDLSSIGMKMKMPRNAKAKPLGSLDVRTLSGTKGGKAISFDTYYPEDLWMRDQLVGRWGDKDFMVSVYNLILPSAAAVPVCHNQNNHTFVMKDAYDEWKEKQKSVEWDTAKMTSWVEYLLKSKINTEPELMKKYGPKKAVTYKFIVNGRKESYFVYIISPVKNPDKHFLIQFSLLARMNNEKSIEKSQKAINQCLASIVFYTPKKRKSDNKKMTAGKKNSFAKKDWSPEYIASRERVLKNIKNLKGWWYLETGNFIMVANIKNKKTIKELHSGLEKSRGVFAKIFPITQPLNAVSVVKTFQTREGYLAYVGKEREGSAGLWMSSRKELVVSPRDWGSVRDRRKAMVEVIKHEGFHQYIYFATGGQHAATWFNEGNATFFEGVKLKGKKPVIEEVSRWMEDAKSFIPGADIEQLINMSQREYYSNPDRNYPLGYGLMFFLHKGAPIMKDKNKYSEIPTKYYEALIKTKSPKKATEIAWYGVDMAEFTSELRKFFASKRLIKKAIDYDLLKAKEAEFAKKKSEGEVKK